MGFIENFSKLVRMIGGQPKVQDKDKAILEIAAEVANGGGKFGKILKYYEVTAESPGDVIALFSQLFFDYSKLYESAKADIAPIDFIGLNRIEDLSIYVDGIELFGFLEAGQTSIDMLEESIAEDCLINETGKTNDFLLENLESGHDGISVSLFIENDKMYIRAIKYYEALIKQY